VVSWLSQISAPHDWHVATHIRRLSLCQAAMCGVWPKSRARRKQKALTPIRDPGPPSVD
jgi:hypothetical protein